MGVFQFGSATLVTYRCRFRWCATKPRSRCGMRLNERSPNVSTTGPNDNRVAIAFSTERNSGIGGNLIDQSPISKIWTARELILRPDATCLVRSTFEPGVSYI